VSLLSYHRPVLLAETLKFLDVQPGHLYVDCTVGGGGHSRAILSLGGRVLGLDRDPEAMEEARRNLEEFGDRVILVRENFRQLPRVLEELSLSSVQGILVDLGVSSHQLDDPQRGFSYQKEGPLDMRMDPNIPSTAADLINQMPEAELARIIKSYGEERWAKRIASFIADERRQKPLATTGQLVSVIKKAIPAGAREEGGHPAKRTFQAVRIAVNNELGNLEEALQEMPDLLAPGGRLVVISFHSLEDKIVKNLFGRLAKGCVCPPKQPICTCGLKPVLRLLNRTPLRPSPKEMEDNPRSRSAKLRAAEKL